MRAVRILGSIRRRERQRTSVSGGAIAIASCSCSAVPSSASCRCAEAGQHACHRASAGRSDCSCAAPAPRPHRQHPGGLMASVRQRAGHFRGTRCECRLGRRAPSGSPVAARLGRGCGVRKRTLSHTLAIESIFCAQSTILDACRPTAESE